MGQYWKPVNLDKKEFINPHKLGCGLKLWEQVANHPATGTALTILCAAMSEPRGGGDLDMDKNWHGPERDMSNPAHHCSPGPMPEDYAVIAKRTIGRWAGDRIALVGDYAEDSDLPNSPIPASQIYTQCCEDEFTDITDDVCRVIEHELNGKFEGDGWRKFVPNKEQV